jgi:hypothetical protein
MYPPTASWAGGRFVGMQMMKAEMGMMETYLKHHSPKTDSVTVSQLIPSMV